MYINYCTAQWPNNWDFVCLGKSCTSQCWGPDRPSGLNTMEALNEKLIKLKNNNAQLIKLNVENIGCETTCCLVHYVHTH